MNEDENDDFYQLDDILSKKAIKMNYILKK